MNAPVARSARRILMRAGIPLAKRYLVLPCMTGDDTSGLFTEFLAVLGALAQNQQWQSVYAGLSVDYGDQGLYYDPAFGPNWWQYYFEPIDIGAKENAAVKTIDPHQHDALTYRAAAMSRTDAYALIARYVRLKAHIRGKVDAYVRENFESSFVVGIHYRGTDKHEEAPRVPYQDVVAAVHRISSAVAGRWKLFVATDEQAFLDYMIERFPGAILSRPMFRSRDGRPIDVTNDDSNYRKGEDAVIDCVLLSRTNWLVRSASNLSLCATFFNADLPEIALNRPYYAPA